MVRRYFILLFLLFITTELSADTWKAPEIIVTYSQNKEYMLKVYPIEYPKNYFTRKYRRQYKKGIIKDTIVPCHAILYKISNSDTIEIWNKPLVNKESPVNVIVANDGKSIVTFDDWHWRGYSHTMVIYGENGNVIKDYELKEISPFPLETYLRSISSIFWGSKGKYVDNSRVEVYFENEINEIQKRVFNIKLHEFEE